MNCEYINIQTMSFFMINGCRYMRPGTPHHVISTKDTIAIGGHFFSFHHFSRTLDSVMVEHFVADSITNTDHTEVHIVLFKMLRRYRDGLSNVTSK